jgi:hypothetical protein
MLHEPFFVPASIILLVALPLALGVIPPNRFYGVRTPLTLADAPGWYAVNRLAGWALMGASLFYLALAALWPSTLAGSTDLGRWTMHLIGFAGSLLLSLQLVRTYLQRFSQAAPTRPQLKQHSDAQDRPAETAAAPRRRK